MEPSVIAPPAERIITHWRRFSQGLWRVPEGDISAAYCADTLPKINVFVHEGRRFANGGCIYSKLIHSEVDAYPLLPADEYNGPVTVPYSYQGRAVTHKGMPFRLGAKVVFVASDPTVEEWRTLLRTLFAEGGLFTFGCNYQEFLTNRVAPETDHGREARFREVAECAAGTLPGTNKAEMRALLDGGLTTIKSAACQLELSL